MIEFHFYESVKFSSWQSVVKMFYENSICLLENKQKTEQKDNTRTKEAFSFLLQIRWYFRSYANGAIIWETEYKNKFEGLVSTERYKNTSGSFLRIEMTNLKLAQSGEYTCHRDLLATIQSKLTLEIRGKHTKL